MKIRVILWCSIIPSTNILLPLFRRPLPLHQIRWLCLLLHNFPLQPWRRPTTNLRIPTLPLHKWSNGAIRLFNSIKAMFRRWTSVLVDRYGWSFCWLILLYFQRRLWGMIIYCISILDARIIHGIRIRNNWHHAVIVYYFHVLYVCILLG